MSCRFPITPPFVAAPFESSVIHGWLACCASMARTMHGGLHALEIVRDDSALCLIAIPQRLRNSTGSSFCLDVIQGNST